MRRPSIGRLIAIEGIDQSGKRTQSELLAKALSAIGQSNIIVSFPDYSTPIGHQLRAYLSGKIKPNYHVVHMLYAANKWERAQEITDYLKMGRFVIINRYTPSNLAYGSAHGLSLHWLLQLEKDLPKPDLIFVLDVSPEASFARKRRSRDIHEGDPLYLRNVRKAYRRLARKYNWTLIDAEQSVDGLNSTLRNEVACFMKRSA